jgi:hypothetical protein
LASQTWHQWTESRQFTFAPLNEPGLEAVVAVWTTCLATTHDLLADTVAFLANRADVMADEMRLRLTSMTHHDLDLFWYGLSPLINHSGVATVCGWLAKTIVAGAPLEPHCLAGHLDAALTEREYPWLRVVIALAQLVPANALPALLLLPDSRTTDVESWFDTAARTLARLVLGVPSLHAAIAVEPSIVARYLQRAPESHARVLVREGLVSLDTITQEAAAQKFAGLGVTAETVAESVGYLAKRGLTEEIVQRLAEAAQEMEALATAESDDRARSAAERFLFECLETLPETAGRFEANGVLDFSFGPRPAEVDLLARDWRLAVEIDGWFHFRDADDYRRDRRKDWELQRHGFTVLRFLAADVVVRLEEILDTILAARPQSDNHLNPGSASA